MILWRDVLNTLMNFRDFYGQINESYLVIFLR
jgi:hypothetical protein